MKNSLDRNYVWECDYGVRKPLIPVLKTLLDEQSSSQLQMINLFVGENPYNLEFYIVFSYDVPIEGQIHRMMDLMLSTGVRYRPDITHEELLNEMAFRRFNSMTLVDSEMLDLQINLFHYMEREDAANVVSMRHLGNKMPVFLSHTSRNKPEIEDLIPYLNGANLPIWYDAINIDYGESITKKVQEGIRDSGAVIFWITPEFLKSHWCELEMDSFLNRMAEKDDILILSVVHSGVELTQLPIFIRTRKYIKVEEGITLEQVAREIIPTLTKFRDKTK